VPKIKVDPRDVQDISNAITEIASRSGWGHIEIRIEDGKVDEIAISHRPAPKVSLRTRLRKLFLKPMPYRLI
jgi:hypothetical protein